MQIPRTRGPGAASPERMWVCPAAIVFFGPGVLPPGTGRGVMGWGPAHARLPCMTKWLDLLGAPNIGGICSLSALG